METEKTKKKTVEGQKSLQTTAFRLLKKIFVFAVLFAASASIIEIDTQAGSSVGNEPFFTSSFIRKNSREVEVKIMGYEVLLSGGIASELEEES